MNVLLSFLCLIIFYVIVICFLCIFLYLNPDTLSYFIFGPFIRLPTTYNPIEFNIPAMNYSIENGKICIWDYYKNVDNMILYVHGIFSDRTYITRRELCLNLFNLGYHVVSYDSNGYGDSINYNLSEDGLVDSFVILYIYLKKKYNKNIIIWAHSLGTGIALKGINKLYEKNYYITHTVLESPFYDFITAFDKYPLTNYLLYGKHMLEKKLKDIKFTFLNNIYINKNNTKFLLFHAKDDMTIPYCNSVRLAFNCNNCKLILLQKGKHSFIYRNEKIYEYFKNFIIT